MIKYDIEELLIFSKNIRVLLVQNNSLEKLRALEVFNIFFENIDIAKNGIEGWNYFENSKYDLIITSIDMPEMNGLELISKIREISRHTTILVISSDTEKKHFIDLIKLGIDGYILKPVEIEQFSSVVQKTIEKLKDKQELYEYRIELEKKVQEELEKRLESEKTMMQQAKLAAMGEMMDAVAHQWKQPITIMSMSMDMLQYYFEDNQLSPENFNEIHTKITHQKEHMLNTLQEFRDFFRPNKEHEEFSIKHCIESVFLLVKDEFIKNRIKLLSDIQTEFKITGIENEFKHVILNMINNSKDAFNENNIENRIINISTFEKDEYNIIQIEDNAGGVPKNIINDIFKANVTSKPQEKGTGIGLYMTKQIVEKIGAQISVKNIENGAYFTVSIKKEL